MNTKKRFNYNPGDYDRNGYDQNGQHFRDFIAKCERDFRQSFKPFAATELHATPASMVLIKHSIKEEQNVDYGMDADYGFDTNLEIEDNSRRQTIFAIGSGLEGRKEEPLLLFRNDSLPPHCIFLKYKSDDENGDETVPESPVPSAETEKIKQ